MEWKTFWTHFGNYCGWTFFFTTVLKFFWLILVQDQNFEALSEKGAQFLNLWLNHFYNSSLAAHQTGKNLNHISAHIPF